VFRNHLTFYCLFSVFIVIITTVHGNEYAAARMVIKCNIFSSISGLRIMFALTAINYLLYVNEEHVFFLDQIPRTLADYFSGKRVSGFSFS